jgi:hypothetical protein
LQQQKKTFYVVAAICSSKKKMGTDLKDYNFSMIIAAKLYEDAKLSAGRAAEMVGFIEMLEKYGVSVFSASISDLYKKARLTACLFWFLKIRQIGFSFLFLKK